MKRWLDLLEAAEGVLHAFDEHQEGGWCEGLCDELPIAALRRAIKEVKP